MKNLILTSFLFIFINSNAQNIVYFERLNDISNFSVGLGTVETHLVGVDPNVHVKISYTQYIAGSAVPTGWIDLTSTTLYNVYGTTIEARGIYTPTGDTAIITFQNLVSPLSAYEISNVNISNPSQIDVTFVGPDNLCDALADGIFTCASNLLTISLGIVPVYQGGLESVSFNANQSYFSFISPADLGLFFYPFYYPSTPSGTNLNAYIPRIVNRPSSETACDGVVNFERISMVSDVSLKYAINDVTTFTSFSDDQISGVCANDTLIVIGFSPTILAGDTLVETVYVVKSQLDPNAVEFDMSRIEIFLNDNYVGSGCDNQIKFRNNNLTSIYENNAYLVDSKNQITHISIFTNPTLSIGNDYIYASQCQDKYDLYVANLSDWGTNLVNHFSYTILNENNLTDPYFDNFKISQSNSDSNNCSVNVKLSEPINTASWYNLTSYTLDESNPGFPVFAAAGAGQGYYENDTTFSSLCTGLYQIDGFNFLNSKFYIATDSLQKISAHYGDGIEPVLQTVGTVGDPFISSQYIDVPSIDTIFHYWSECTNDYTLPFSTVLFDTNILVNDIPSVVSYFYKYECNFDLTQGLTSIILPMREVLAPMYVDDMYQTIIPYYIVAELYCNDGLKSLTKRRKIILAPDGQIQDLYGSLYSANILENKLPDVSLFPNPVNDVLTISSAQEISTINVIDLNGRNVLNSSSQEIGKAVVLNVNTLPQGSYVIELLIGDQISRKHFVKM